MKDKPKEFEINTFLSTEEILTEFKDHLKDRANHHFGLNYNLLLNHDKLGSFLEFSINNLGDPYVQSNYGVQSRPFEVQVLQYFAHLWKIPSKDSWGYVNNW